MPSLVVNIDHIATLRQARLGHEPEPVTGAHLAELSGAVGIICHLREDRRHIQDRDVEMLRKTINTRLHLEMAATDEMHAICLKTQPYMCCIVPEKRQELTTEGGMDVVSREAELTEFVKEIHAAGIRSSLFIDADPEQIEATARVGCEFVEIHTGHYADAADYKQEEIEFKKIADGIAHAQKLGLKVNLGHGLNYTNILRFKNIPGICEYSIGHSIMSRAIFTGIPVAVKEMRDIINTFVD